MTHFCWRSAPVAGCYWVAALTLRALVVKPAGVVVALVAILRVEKLAKVG